MNKETTNALAIGLLKAKAVRFGNFRLKLHDKNPTAPLSPIYFDLRVLRSHPDVMDLAVAVYSALICPLRYDLLADIPTAATPIVAVLSNKMRVPMISPRLDDKTHGIKRRIDGAYEEGQVAVLVDDLVTKAESKMEAINVLNENGIRVNDIVVLIDREQGGTAELSKMGYKCHSAFTLTGLVTIYRENKMISEEDFSRTMEYLRDSLSQTALLPSSVPPVK